jgi:heptosyltransferase-2
MGTRILIVKLDAIGDVARTTTLLGPLRKKYDPCFITWLVHPLAEGMLARNSMIERVLPYKPESLEALRCQKFDVVLSLDKTARAAGVGMWAQAKEKLGFGLSEFGTIYPLTADCDYAFQLGMDDDLKFRRNRKTYQEVIFECARLPYAREEYHIEIDRREREFADRFITTNGIARQDAIVGLNLGGGSAFAHKMWSIQGIRRFLIRLLNQVECKIALFGAERERPVIEEIMRTRLPRVFRTGTDNTIPQFQALLARCDVVVTGDSLGMHLAIAEKRPVVALFGPTCAQEIELYDRGDRITSPLPCAPCYRGSCERNVSCMDAIEPEPVVAAVKKWLSQAGKLRP